MPFELNPQQQAAVTAPLDKAARVLAGPGSGKTVVIEHRLEYLLDNGVDPKRIVVVTFSRPMADEMLQRIIKLCPEVRGSPLEKRITTIHALLYRLMRAEGDTRKVAKRWQIRKAIEEAAQAEDLEEGWEVIQNWINSAKADCVREGEDESWFREQLVVAGAPVFLAWKLSEIRRRFDRAMRSQNLLTFADMLYDAEVLFQDRPEVLAKWQRWTEHVLVDEGQDTGGQAMRILTALAEPQNQFYLVGDSDQLLYRFAGATPEANLAQGFEERYSDGLTFKLETNYRSTQQIVGAINGLISNNYGDHNEHLHKTLVARPDAPEGDPISWDWFDTCSDEAQKVVEDIKVDLQNGRAPGDYFIGGRTRAQLAWLEGPLVRAKVPFINLAGGSFWASKHVADIVAYLKLTRDRGDKDAFKRVYNVASVWMQQPFDMSDRATGKVIRQKGEYSPTRWLSKAFMRECWESLEYSWRALKSKQGWRWRPGIEDIERLLDTVTKDQYGEPASPTMMVMNLIDLCYRDYLAATEGITGGDEAENGKMEDLYTVAEVAGEYEDLDGFLACVDEMVKAAEAAKEKALDEFLVISTIHRLKGMERKIVYGIGMSERLLPHRFSMEPPPQFGVLPTGGMGRIEDERCCGFVLVSRAKDEVHLSGVQYYRNDVLGPSRFVRELGIQTEPEESDLLGLDAAVEQVLEAAVRTLGPDNWRAGVPKNWRDGG